MEDHVVQFYENDQFLIEKVAGFIGAGLRMEDACIAIATKDHLHALEEALTLRAGQDNYIALDASAVLSKFMIDGWPNEQRFKQVIGEIITQASAGGSRRVRAFGEMVALLCKTESHAAAIHLEQLWNDLASEHAFSLLCAYPMDAFPGAEHSTHFLHVCSAHADVYPSQSTLEPAAPADLHRAIARLQQQKQALECEVARRERNEEALSHARHILIEAQRLAHVGSWEMDVQTGHTEWSDELFRIFGYPPQAFTPSLDLVMARIHPDELAASQANLLRIMAGHQDYDKERRIVRADGEVRHVILRIQSFFSEHLKLVRLVGSVADITGQKLAHLQMQESEERFRSLVDMSSDWYWEQDVQRRYTMASAQPVNTAGTVPDSVPGLAPLDLAAHWDETRRRAFETTWANRQPYHDLESCLTSPDAPPRYFLSSGKPMFNENGLFSGYRGVTKEITERVRNIEDLRRFRAAMDSTADAIFLADHASQTFVDANATACRLLGYTRDELLGLKASDLGSISPERLKALSDGLVSGKNYGLETIRIRHKDGSRLQVEMQRHAIRSGQGWIIVAVARDIRERKRTEAALRQSQEELRQLAAHQENIKEEERKRIAREIHDELGGVLTGINANLSVSINRSATAGHAPDPLLVDAARLADEAIETVRRVITDLRPSVLDQLGVWAALEWYAGQIHQRTGLPCSCMISNSAAITELDPERSTMLFRVVQEALTNVVRHAAASQAAIIVEREEDAIIVEIKDDGKGLDAKSLLDGQSWGILGMHERTRHFGGKININGTLGKGTAVVLRLPLEHKNGS